MVVNELVVDVEVVVVNELVVDVELVVVNELVVDVEVVVVDELVVDVELVVVEDELALVVTGWLVVVLTLVGAGACRKFEGDGPVHGRINGERSICRCREPGPMIAIA